jgi:hypothetical protein
MQGFFRRGMGDNGGGNAKRIGRANRDQQGPFRLFRLPQDVEANGLIQLGQQSSRTPIPVPELQAADGSHGAVLQGTTAAIGASLARGRAKVPEWGTIRLK